ncbi:hypothetical protein [Robiginitalea sediminis]|uniref:hypothetical protein n=1 Tax=Robiginitalea sediminis TaxID=1982593 RepID=UPI000B4B27C0|nr:hypothetical protein [Robiginitalea sediminis]
MKTEIAFLIKFGKKEHLTRLLKEGEIYMNSIEWFKNHEKDGVGDLYEGAMEIKNYKQGTLTLKLDDKPLVFPNSSLQLRKYHEGHIGNIFSSYALHPQLLKRKSIHRIDKRMLKFGDHCLLIRNTLKFYNSINNRLKELGISCSHNLVRYKNFKRDEINLSLFEKSHLLAYQKEHRIIAWTKSSEPLKFKIGSIEEYAELFDAERIVNNATLDFKPNIIA